MTWAALATWLMTTPEGQATAATALGLVTHLGASIVNVFHKNEPEDASLPRKAFGKTVRALSLTLGEAQSKKKENE